MVYHLARISSCNWAIMRSMWASLIRALAKLAITIKYRNGVFQSRKFGQRTELRFSKQTRFRCDRYDRWLESIFFLWNISFRIFKRNRFMIRSPFSRFYQLSFLSVSLALSIASHTICGQSTSQNHYLFGPSFGNFSITLWCTIQFRSKWRSRLSNDLWSADEIARLFEEQLFFGEMHYRNIATTKREP